MHSLKTPSRSTIRSCVRSRPSRCTFQYIQSLGAIVGFVGVFRTFPDLGRVLLAHQARRRAARAILRLHQSPAAFANSRRHPFAHLLAHEHRVRADVDDPLLLEQAADQRLDVRINQRLAAADRDHRRVAFLRRAEAILQAHHVLERGRIFANPAAAGAGQVAGMQRLELEDGGELLRPPQLVADDVRRDLGRQRERESHKGDDSNNDAVRCQ